MPRVPSLTLLVLATALGAADGREAEVADLRFSIGSTPVPNHADGYYSRVGSPSVGGGVYVGAPREEMYRNTTGIAGEISAIYGHLAPLGFVYGGGFRYAGAEVPWEARRYPGAAGYQTLGGVLDNQDLKAQGYTAPDMTWSSSSLVGEAGLGWAFAPAWHAELMATLSADWVTMDSLSYSVADSTVSRQTGKGLGYTFGARLGFYWTSDAHWQYGFGGAWSKSRAQIETSYADNTAKSVLQAIGFSGYGSIGYRF